jgi:AraC family transcriptional regulator, ethanolamine operon transcriptional activator
MKTLLGRADIGPAAVTVEEIRDPTAAGAGPELIDLRAVQLQPMPLDARRVTARLGEAAVLFHSTNLRLRTRTSVREGWLAWVAFGPRASGTVNGLPVRAGLVLAVAPDKMVGFVTNAGWESVTILVSARELDAQLSARRREAELRLPRGVEILDVQPERCGRLFGWGKRLVDVATRQPDRFGEGRPERSAAQVELLEILLATVGAAPELEPSRGDRSRRAQSLLVKRAEEFALENAGEHLHVGDLCRAAATSERTLEYAFREILGTTPIAYLTRLRLHRVRQALLAADRGSTTVSAEALDAGFWHFGEFARAYRNCFGELPSATLRRRSESTAVKP